LKDAYRFEEEKLRAKGKGKDKVLDFPVQRATENPEQVTAEETPPQVAPDAQQI
jgi:hypothetical protein